MLMVVTIPSGYAVQEEMKQAGFIQVKPNVYHKEYTGPSLSAWTQIPAAVVSLAEHDEDAIRVEIKPMPTLTVRFQGICGCPTPFVSPEQEAMVEAEMARAGFTPSGKYTYSKEFIGPSWATAQQVPNRIWDEVNDYCESCGEVVTLDYR